MSAVWDWLVVQGGIYHALVTVVLGLVVGWGLGTAKFVPAWRRHEEQQKVIADRLDTRTPGGLGDVVAAVREAKP